MRFIAFLGKAAATGLVVCFAVGVVSISPTVLPLAFSVLFGISALCDMLADSRPPRRPWCLHRENGHIRFHRRVDQKRLAALERGLELGPDGTAACAERLAGEVRSLRDASERTARSQRRWSGLQTAEDVLKDVAAVFAMPEPLVGTSYESESVHVGKEMWRSLYENVGPGIVLPPGWKIERLQPDRQSVLCSKIEDRYARYNEQAASWLDKTGAYPPLPMDRLYD